MTSTAADRPQRRTQEQRSSEMRVRLLDATIDCLVEYGYAGTTTPRVAERAGVTRGAQVHHFGSKHDLVVAAIKHLAERRVAAAMSEMTQVRVGDDPVGAALEFLWDLHQGPLFIATVELWVAGRTDPVLAAAMEEVEPVVNTAVLRAIAELIPDDLHRKGARDFTYTAMDALRGILVANFVVPDPERAHRRWRRAMVDLRAAAATVIASGPR
ncbi:putative TetR-family transcriptional regulator [Nocardia neocaledoniensis NBRC 108232]|uniref:TetR family transcriptional regulator n=1 Tax=Nocardia neocaledoniensis TaxID=236511 RepID=A0A317NUS2_9NOCA|nr:TetR/AcrR family transcriptional regulator [Nocardia neocaledoniensis]PWV77558.1 TetR family transcriptional regulator [Nocardia neocaledoniensis]GEM32887.1 putative TetR-family transcriptional regulator [Nocardia neocaledoniensis NBRC 108232]